MKNKEWLAGVAGAEPCVINLQNRNDLCNVLREHVQRRGPVRMNRATEMLLPIMPSSAPAATTPA